MRESEIRTWYRLTLLAVRCREKYIEDHPDLKNGDRVDIDDYLFYLFDLMVSAGVTFPPAHVGDIIYMVQFDFKDNPLIREVEVHGSFMIENKWYIYDEKNLSFLYDEAICFRTKEDAEACIRNIVGGYTGDQSTT